MAKNIIIILSVICLNKLGAQSSGYIFNTNNKPISGAKVILLKTGVSNITTDKGQFYFQNLGMGDSIEVSATGFITDKFVYLGEKPWEIFMQDQATSMDAITITHHKQKEKLRESPVTLERLSAKDIKETPASDFYEGLGYLRGVDVTSASMGFKVINTRGFNSTSPVRSLQLIDGVDNQSPGLNFSLGNFLGASELDILNADIIVGASSAYYGPNAFNGVVNMVTKSPWTSPGFSAQVKVGERQLGQLMMRYAQVYKNKQGRPMWAWKANVSYMRAYDWVANNADPTPDSKTDNKNPGGYDAVNRYGDEIFGSSNSDNVSNSSKVQRPGLGAYYPDGYWEKDLVNYNTRNLKTSFLLAYKPSSRVEWQYGFNFGTGTTVYQGDNRYSLNDILFFQNRLELKIKNSFIRFYATNEDAGNTYDAVLTSFLMRDYYKKNSDWNSDYLNYWQTKFSNRVKALPNYPTGNPISNPNWYMQQEQVLQKYYDSLVVWHAIARAVANSDKNDQGLPRTYTMYPRYEAGTQEFNDLKKSITSRNSYSKDGKLAGSRFFDRSALYHLNGEHSFYKYKSQFRVGFSSRLYRPYSQGTIFLDTGNNRLSNYEAGIYAGVEKRFLKNKLKTDLTIRLDKNQNFNLLFSPAASIIYSKNKKSTWRFGVGSAVRNPTLQDQYLHYNVGRAILLGNIKGINNVYEVQDFINYLTTRNYDTLRKINVKAIQPEKVKTIEASYKGSLARNRLTLDAGAYFSRYKDFLGYKIVIDADIDTINNFPRTVQTYRIATNSADVVYTYGASIGSYYFFKKKYVLSANWNWNKLDRAGSTDPLIPAFNTPANKVNVGIGGSNLTSQIGKTTINNWGFNINWKWVQGFKFEGSPQFTGSVPSYNSLDAQISKEIKKWKSTFKIGASNVLNNKFYTVYGGPIIGRLAYISLTYEP